MNAALIDRLTPAQGVLDMVLDTDTYNEVDDQFALCYAMTSPERLNVRAVYAAPFTNSRSNGPEDGMEKSYDEIVRLLGKLGKTDTDGFVFKGSRRYLPNRNTPVDSPAARDIVQKALAQPEGRPLYVVAIGAITNVASAILLDKRIIDKIVVVWLGGNALYWQHTAEFNLAQDVPAAQVVFDCGCAVTMMPCMPVASHLLATPAELREMIGGKNAVCDALIELFSAYSTDHFGWAKEIWDVSVIGYLVNPDWAPSVLQPSPILTVDGEKGFARWSRDEDRHFVRVVTRLDRNTIFRDMYTKLARA